MCLRAIAIPIPVPAGCGDWLGAGRRGRGSSVVSRRAVARRRLSQSQSQPQPQSSAIAISVKVPALSFNKQRRPLTDRKRAIYIKEMRQRQRKYRETFARHAPRSRPGPPVASQTTTLLPQHISLLFLISSSKDSNIGIIAVRKPTGFHVHGYQV